MADPARPLLVGAVAYHPRVVTVWEGFRPYFRERHLDLDYVLFSNYERLVDALIDGVVDLAWNTNTAYVSAQARLGGRAQVLGMRDVDAGYATVLVARSHDVGEPPDDLAGHGPPACTPYPSHASPPPIH